METTIVKNEKFHLYVSNNLFYVDTYDYSNGRCIPWYKTLHGAIEALYYADAIPERELVIT